MLTRRANSGAAAAAAAAAAPAAMGIVSAVAEQVGGNVQQAVAVVQIANVLWELITGERKPFSTRTRERYNKLVALYRACTGASEPPEQWKLDEEGCPMHRANFVDLVEKLNTVSVSLRNSQANFKIPANTIICLIASLFTEFERRRGNISSVRGRLCLKQ